MTNVELQVRPSKPRHEEGSDCGVLGVEDKGWAGQFHLHIYDAKTVDDDGVYLTKDSVQFFDAYKYDLQASFEKCFNVPDKKIQKSKKLLYGL